jgi:hypothetical protein
MTLACASIGSDGPGEDEVQSDGAPVAADPQQDSPPGEAARAATTTPSGGAAALSQADARKRFPKSGGIDPARWLSPRDRGRVLPASKVTAIYDDVVYQPAAVVFDVESVEAFQPGDESKGEYRFDAAKLSESGVELSTGKTFMIPGLALRKVTAVRTDGGVLVASTEQGALNDVIRDGTVGFKAKLSLDPQHVIGWFDQHGSQLPTRALPTTFEDEFPPPAGLLGLSASLARPSTAVFTRFPDFGLLAAAPANPDAFDPEHMKWTFEKAGIAYQLEIDVRGEDAKILIKATKASGADSEFQYWAKGTFKNVYLDAKGEYKDGEVQSLEYKQPDMVGDMEVSIAAAGKGQGKKEINFVLPEAMLRYVFPVGSIPIVVEISAKMIGRVEVPSKGSATATAKFKWSGQTGLKYEGTDIKAEGVFHSVDIKPDPFDSASMMGNSVDAQWGVAIPRVSAGAFGTFFVPYIQPGITIGSHLKWGPLCKSGYVRFNVTAGWDFGVMGVSLAQHKHKVYEKEQRAPKGGCK